VRVWEGLLDGLHVGSLWRLCTCVCERCPGTAQPWTGVFGMNERECGGDVLVSCSSFLEVESTWTGYDVAGFCEMKLPSFSRLATFFTHNITVAIMDAQDGIPTRPNDRNEAVGEENAHNVKMFIS
jgi:hypothetical protein